MANRAFIFVRRSGAYGIGHVGWAFTEENDIFTAGSVENHGGGLRTLPSEMDFWMLRTRDPIAPMRDRHYDEFKVIDLEQADPIGAKRVIFWVKQQVYATFGRNCMDDVYDVLRVYGVQQLPVPAQHWEPNHWFDQVQGAHYRIDDAGVAPEDDKMKPVMSSTVEPGLVRLEGSPDAEETPAAPTWRTPETEEAYTFQATLATVRSMPVVSSQSNQSATQGLLSRLMHLFGFEDR